MASNVQEIPVEYLDMNEQPSAHMYRKALLENEIEGIHIDHISLTGVVAVEEKLEKEYKYMYIFIKGNGTIVANKERFKVSKETIFLPNSLQSIAIDVEKNEALSFLKIACESTEQDYLDLIEFPKEHTQKPYFVKFTDCEAYTEPIKSPNTISRTVLPNKYIPRIALGTVETTGPDKVAAHEHPMLEQLFLGLSDNQVIVYADDKKIAFPAYSLLHIPLGASHSVEVKEGNKMYYMWMDFFLDKKGEEWLKTHHPIKK